MRGILLWAFALTACRDDGKTIEAETEEILLDEDGDGFASTEDCDDNDPQINSGSEEICDGLDNNCDGEIDEDVSQVFYADSDNDGFGSPTIIVEACALPDGFVANGNDCDDINPVRYPGAPELCDGLDNDCDDVIDNGLNEIFYEDLDDDGFGSDVELEGCMLLDGMASLSGDCNDTDPLTNPLADELCDGLDNNCDDAIDEGLGIVFFLDADEDGFGDLEQTAEACSQPEGYVSDSTDCDDIDSLNYPGAVEYCDGQDNNCDGSIDEGEAINALLWYADYDQDGYGTSSTSIFACNAPSLHVANTLDCDDGNNTINPDADELCDEIDNNCDGDIDEQGAINAPEWYLDADQDGFGGLSSILACDQPTGYTTTSDDCDDFDNDINPDAVELCDGEDNNCDGTLDEDSAADAPTWFLDGDEDGFGTANTVLSSCSQQTGYVSDNTDCDDGTDAINPDADELCDEVDNNCDGDIDEQGAIDSLTWYLDADQDGYGSSSTILACTEPTGYTTTSDDCDDFDNDINPDAVELCDGEDNNCDGNIDDEEAIDPYLWYLDNDSDGYGDSTVSVLSCDAPTGYVDDDSDCNDNDDAIIDVCVYSSCKELLEHEPTTVTGIHTIEVNNTELDVYCDMDFEGGGWTLVSTIPLSSSSCVFSTSGTLDPATANGICSKYSDAEINEIAEEKIFFATVPGYEPTFTKYSDSINVDSTPGNVIQGGSYASVVNETPIYTPGYGGWRYFHQENWYQSDTCLGASAGHARLSLEYIVNTGNLYACSGGCSGNCPSGAIRSGTSEVFIR